MKQPATLAALSALLLAPTVSAATLLSIDFDATTPGSFADGSVINGGTATPTDNLDVAAGAAGAATPNNGGTTGVDVVTQSVGDNALTLTKSIDQFVTDGRPFVSAPLAGISTDAAGDNRLDASFTYTRLVDEGGMPVFSFLLNTEDNVNPSAAVTIIQVEVRGDGFVRYHNGSGFTVTSLQLAADVDYIFEVSADFSDPTQDSWDLTVATAAAPSTLLVNAQDIDTRQANATPGIVLFKGGVAAAANKPTAFAAIDDIEITAIPEPASLVLAVTGLALIGVRRH